MASQLQIDRPYTAGDLESIEDALNRYEIIGGELIVSPGASEPHQWASIKLSSMILDHVLRRQLGAAYTAPFDVHLSEHDVVQPDILVVLNANRKSVSSSGLAGPPDLVIEIVSPSSSRIDRVRKAATYATFGVPEYWIADPADQSILAQTLVGQHYEPMLSNDGLVHSKAIAGLVIDPVAVFAVPDWMTAE